MSFTTIYVNILNSKYKYVYFTDSQKQNSLSLDEDTVVTGKELVGVQKVLQVEVKKHTQSTAGSSALKSSKNKNEMEWNSIVSVNSP